MKTINLVHTAFYFAVAVLLSLFIQSTPALLSFFTTGPSGFYMTLTLLLSVSYAMNHISSKEQVPVYAWAILFGLAFQGIFMTLITDMNTLKIIVELLATFVLFASGMHVPVKNFKKYFAPIATLSILGTLLTVLLFALLLSVLTTAFGFSISPIALLILAAILSSIDPATVIPTLEKLHFKRPFLRDIAISESATNDIVGVIVTRFFLIASLGTATSAALTVQESFLPILSKEVVQSFTAEIIWSVLIGALGAWILRVWGESAGKKHWSDQALFLIVPVFCFALGSIFGGTGFLAAFIAGLLFEGHQRTHEVQHFFTSTVDRFMKPVIFVLVGTLLPLSTLLSTMALGTLSAILFIFVIRPFVVFLSLSPWMITKRSFLHWRDIIFLSLIRETGAIPAVLILLTTALGILHADFIFSIGVWIILYTLIIEPPLTILLAKKLEVAE